MCTLRCDAVLIEESCALVVVSLGLISIVCPDPSPLTHAHTQLHVKMVLFCAA
jgi:hypothetical protein